MDASRALREAVVFFAITLGLSYLVFWGPLALFGIAAISFVSGQRGPGWAVALFMIGGFVPSAAGVVLTAARGGRPALKRLGRRAIQFRIGWRCYLSILLLIAVMAAGQLLINHLLGHSFAYRLFLLQLPSALPLVILGPLSEELGWRGYALDRLQAKMSGLASGLLVGVVWGLWHLPLFLMPGTSQHELAAPFLGFLVGVMSTSVLMTVFHNASGGSIVTAFFFHWVYTYSAQVTASGVTRSPLYDWLEYAPYLLAAVAAVVLFGAGLRSPARREVQR